MANKFADFAQALAGGDSNQTLKGRLIGGRLQNQGLKNTQLTNEIGERKALFESLAGNKDLTNSIRSGEGFSAGKFNLGKESRAAAGESRLVDGLAALVQSNPEIAKFVSAGVSGPDARAFQRVQNDDDLTLSNVGLNKSQAGRVDNLKTLDTNESIANVLKTGAEADAASSLSNSRLADEKQTDAETLGVPAQLKALLDLTNQQTNTSKSGEKLNDAKAGVQNQKLASMHALGGVSQKDFNTAIKDTIKLIKGSGGGAFGGGAKALQVTLPDGRVVSGDTLSLEQLEQVAQAHVSGRLKLSLGSGGGGKLKAALAKDGGPSEQQSEQPESQQASQESFVDAIDEMRSRNPNNPEVINQLLQRVQSAKGKIPDEEYNRLLRSLQDLI